MAIRERERTELERRLDEERGHGWRKWLAEAMGVSRVALHKWITGRAPWPPGRRDQVCELTGFAYGDIFEMQED